MYSQVIDVYSPVPNFHMDSEYHTLVTGCVKSALPLSHLSSPPCYLKGTFSDFRKVSLFCFFSPYYLEPMRFFSTLFIEVQGVEHYLCVGKTSDTELHAHPF